jgi:thiol:disulfide interchange protein DsbD
MAFLVLAVAVYFAGGRIAAKSTVFLAIFGVICAAMIFMVVQIGRLTRRIPPIAVSIAFAAIVIFIAFSITQRFIGGLQWQPYSVQAFADARATGKPVLVEFTANWCPNCLSIEASVYHDPRTRATISQYDVILIRADLTSEDAAGWPKVNELNPGGGIPLTAIYSAHADQPDKLTSLYTSQNLIDAIKRAASS